MDETNRKVLAGLLAVLAKSPPVVPYGFDATGCCFDTQGQFLPPPVGKGLTCATFIVALLRVYGYELVAEATWPVRAEDDAWRQDILTILQDYATPEHVKPDEVRRLRKEGLGATEIARTLGVGRASRHARCRRLLWAVSVGRCQAR